jgi:hypothetical protein
MLTLSSSNVVILADHQTEAKVKPKPQWGKAGCSDWLVQVGGELTNAEFKATFFLSRHANQWTGEAHPGAPLLAFETGMDERQVDRALDAVARKGIIEKIAGKRGRGHSARYRLISNLERNFGGENDENDDA